MIGQFHTGYHQTMCCSSSKIKFINEQDWSHEFKTMRSEVIVSKRAYGAQEGELSNCYKPTVHYRHRRNNTYDQDVRQTDTSHQIWENGDQFVGNIRNERRNGWGYYIAKTGETYEGTFFEDQRHGYGLSLGPNGSFYFGTYFLDQRSGYGISRDSINNIYEGFFMDNRPEGPGILTTVSDTAENSIDVGYWSRGRLARLPETLTEGDQFNWEKFFPEYDVFLGIEAIFQSDEREKDSSVSATDENVNVQANECSINKEVIQCIMANQLENKENYDVKSRGLFFQEPADLKYKIPVFVRRWDKRSHLYLSALADLLFRRLLHCDRPVWKNQLDSVELGDDLRSILTGDMVIDDGMPAPTCIPTQSEQSGITECVNFNTMQNKFNVN